MTQEEMERFVATLVDEARLDEFVPVYVGLAKDAVVNHVFPFRDDACWEVVPEKDDIRSCEIAVYLINRRGAEGETSHSESGTSRSYESAGIPSSYFDGLVPFAGVPK